MRAAIATAVVLAAAVGGCGGNDGGSGAEPKRGPVAWAAEPSVIDAQTADRAKILQGVVRNSSAARVELEASELTVRERDGDEVPASVVFLSGYVRPGEAQNRGPAELSEQERERLGKVARIGAGETAPLVVSWRTRDGRPHRIVFPGGSLPVPRGAR